MGRYTKLRRNLLDLCVFNRALVNDMLFAWRGLTQACNKKEDQFEKAFWVRVTVRCFFAYVEGLSSFMRSTAARPANAKKLGLSEKERAELLERRYDKESDRITDQLMFNSVAENIKLGFRNYSRLFGANFTLDTNSPTWKGFIRKLVPARNSMTHAGRLEDFYPREAALTVYPCYLWFLKSTLQILQSCSDQIGVTIPDHGEVHIQAFDESTYQPLPSRESFYDEVAKFQSRSLETLTHSTRLHDMELIKSINDVTQRNEILGMNHQGTQFSVRNWLRTTINYAEGMTDMLKLFIGHAKARGEIDLTVDEADMVSRRAGAEILEHLKAMFNLFSKKFGHQKHIEIKPKHWEAAGQVLLYRDRLTHPKRLSDLEFKDTATLDLLVNTLEWHCDIITVIQIDADRLVQQEIQSGSIPASGTDSEEV